MEGDEKPDYFTQLVCINLSDISTEILTIQKHLYQPYSVIVQTYRQLQHFDFPFSSFQMCWPLLSPLKQRENGKNLAGELSPTESSTESKRSSVLNDFDVSPHKQLGCGAGSV